MLFESFNSHFDLLIISLFPKVKIFLPPVHQRQQGVFSRVTGPYMAYGTIDSILFLSHDSKTKTFFQTNSCLELQEKNLDSPSIVSASVKFNEKTLLPSLSSRITVIQLFSYILDMKLNYTRRE